MELKKAIDQISKDKGIDRDMLIQTLEDAVRTSVHRKYGDDVDLEVSFNEEMGEIEVYHFKIVTKEVTDPTSQISLEEALTHDPSVQEDDEMGFRLNVGDLGRIAAQSAKQVIIQRMRDAELEIIFEEYKDRKGEIVSGIVQRRDKAGWVVNLGRTEALLPKEEQIPREHYKRGDRVEAIVIDVRKEGRGPQVIVSRAHRDYMGALFKREVPEVDEGIVQIMGIARDPGSRAKVAVMSRDRDIDPVGACVGIRGSRIQNIVQELRGERIDIVVWSPDIATYARNALAPAIISRITVDEDENLLEIVVPDDQLTNSIGRKGQNVKLAAKLLGWKIDVFTETRHAEIKDIGQGLEQISSVVELPIEQFLDVGFTSIDLINKASDQELIDAIEGLDADKVANLRSAINFLGLESKTEQGSSEEAPAEETEAEA